MLPTRLPPAAYADDELLRPVLTEEDDAVGIERPWNPWSLVVLAFFFGLPAGGGLLSWNLYRLGVPRRMLPALLVVFVGSLGLAMLDGWLSPRLSEKQQPLALIAVRAGTTLIAAGLARAQRKRFRVFRHTGKDEGKLFLPGLVAAVLSLLLLGILHAVFVNVFIP